MKNIKIRELKPGDMGKIGDLLRTREELDEEGAKKRMQLLEWLAFKNPFADNEPTYFVAEEDGRIIAHLGRMPTKFVIKGKPTKGYFFHDLYVHPEYRKKGSGFFLSMSLFKAIEDRSESFCCGVWSSHFTIELERLRGYHELWAHAYVKVINPDEQLNKFFRPKFLVRIISPILRNLIFLVDSILLRPIPSNIKISKIDRFDFHFDNLNQKVLHKAGISSFKESRYLNWKIIDRPFSQTVVFAAKRNEQLNGFVVVCPNVKKKYPEGTIIDIMADPDDKRIISALIRKAIEYFTERNVYSIMCFLTDKRFLKILRRFFFIKEVKGMPVMLANLEKCEERTYLADINHWHLTLSDSDAFMLDP